MRACHVWLVVCAVWIVRVLVISSFVVLFGRERRMSWRSSGMLKTRVAAFIVVFFLALLDMRLLDVDFDDQ